MSHTCPDCGLEHEAVASVELAPVDMEPVTDATVRVAEIEAERDVTLARIHAKADTEISRDELTARIAELEGQLAGMSATMAAMAPAPEPEPVPVVVQEPEPEPVITEPVTPAPPLVDEAPKGKKKSNPWWS